MVEEVGAPCMEYARHSPLQPMALIELPQGVPCGTEHAGVEQPLVRHSYWMQAVRNGEDHVEVLHARHHLFLAHLYLHLAFLVLALGTMTVSAAVVADMDIATLGADLHMTTQCSCAADGHRRERLEVEELHPLDDEIVVEIGKDKAMTYGYWGRANDLAYDSIMSHGGSAADHLQQEEIRNKPASK